MASEEGPETVKANPGECYEEGEGFVLRKIHKEHVKLFKDCFEFFDKDSNGVIDKADLIKVMQAIGLNPSEKDAAEMIATVAEKGQDSISWPAFEEMLNNSASKSVEQSQMEMLVTFHVFDNNKDGFVDATDFQKTLTSMGEPIGEMEAKLMLGTMDETGKGKLGYTDFVNHMYGIQNM